MAQIPRLFPRCPYEIQADSHRDEECQGVVHEHIGAVIGGLEEQGDEQVVEHNRDRGPRCPDPRVIGKSKVPYPEPPPRDRDGDRGADGKEYPAHDARNRREEEQERCKVPDQPETRAKARGVFEHLLHVWWV